MPLGATQEQGEGQHAKRAGRGEGDMSATRPKGEGWGGGRRNPHIPYKHTLARNAAGVGRWGIGRYLREKDILHNVDFMPLGIFIVT